MGLNPQDKVWFSNMFEDVFQMITRVAVSEQLYLFLYPSKGRKCYMSNLYQCFYVYFQMLDIFTFYVFVVLPKFLLLAVHCRYRLSLYASWLGNDRQAEQWWIIIQNHTSVPAVFLRLEVLSPVPRTWLQYFSFFFFFFNVICVKDYKIWHYLL